MQVKRGKQVQPKQQPVRVSYWTNVRRPRGKGQLVSKVVWLVQVRVLAVDWEPWLLLTDWPVVDAQGATRIFGMYRQRWSVEDAFKFVKTSLGWEEVQLLARLGGWEPHKDRLPGKITLQRGLSRLLEMLVTQALLADYATEHHGLPPRIAALLHGWQPPGDL